MNLEEVLEYLEQSEDDVEPKISDELKPHDRRPTPAKEVDYNEIYNELIRESSSNDSDSLEYSDLQAGEAGLNAEKKAAKPEDPSNPFSEEPFTNGFIPDLPLDASVASVSSKYVRESQKTFSALDKTGPKFDADFDLSESVNIPAETIETPKGDLREESRVCHCDLDTAHLIKESTSNCGELFGSVKHSVEKQLSEWDNKHKLHLIHKLNRIRNRPPQPGEDKSHTTDDSATSEPLVPDISKRYLKTLGLPSSTLVEDNHSSKLTIRCRHKLSNSLELLKIFEDRFYPIDDSTTNRLTKSSTNLLTPTCVCSSSDLVLFGTMCGSVFISEFSTYNSERKFCSYNEYEAMDPSLDPLSWYEIDCEKGLSVTALDILPNVGWITVGYNDGTVKLLQNFRVTRPSKGNTSARQEPVDAKNTDTRTFGLMADAVSSAFSGMKKTSSQTLCTTDVFNDSVLNCKFTSESYEEIICSNLKCIAILTYSKNVLSHNLNVNYLQSLNERLENDQIVDIVCLSSNPQAKFITGGDVGGICAILTFKTCLIFSTRPRLSILINVNLDKLNRSLSPDLSQVPSVTWMIFNSGKKNIKPLLLISLGNQVRFVQCNLQNAKGALTMNVSNMGTIQFRHTVRGIRIVTRLILAVVDSMNVLHIVQVNLTASPMHYDIIRSLDLNEFSNKMELGIDVFDPLWLIQTSLLSTITVYAKTVKMVAKGYKKFSNLVSDLFQGKKHTSSFELKNFTVLILVPNGVVGIEINSWVKVIGELSASKMFCEALAIVHALSEEWLPGLYDFRAFKNNLSQLVLYILHQSSAHIIKLSKFVNETQNISTNLLNLDSEAPKDDFWNSRVKTDVYEQINTLCCSMIDSCVSAKMYEPLNDLIFRCFATIDLEHVFVKYILLNFYNNRITLQFLNSQIIESICHTYEIVLDSMCEEFLRGQLHLDDEMLYINQVLSSQSCARAKHGAGVADESGRSEASRADPEVDVCRYITNFEPGAGALGSDYLLSNFRFDSRLLAYHIICNNLCKIQLYCFKNNVITDTNKAVSRLSRHFSWHSLIYCHSVVLDDYSNLLEIILAHATSKCEQIRDKICETLDPKALNTENQNLQTLGPESPSSNGESPSSIKAHDNYLEETESEMADSDSAEVPVEDEDELGDQEDETNSPEPLSDVEESVTGGSAGGAVLPLSVSENLFVVRVLFLTLESFLTFENCGLTDTVDTSSYCNLVAYLTATDSFKLAFPVQAKPLFARETLLYELVSIDYEKIDFQRFAHEFERPEETAIFKLIKVSPRLLFVCLLNLFANCPDKFRLHSNAIGTRVATFNLLMNVVIASMYSLEDSFGPDGVRMIRDMVSFLFLRVASGPDGFSINLNTAFLAIYTLLTAREFVQDLGRQRRPDLEYSRELIQPDGYFNDACFSDVFYRRDESFNHACVMVLTRECADRLIFTYLKDLVYSICSRLKSPSELGQNAHFAQLVRMCREFIHLTSSSMRFFFYQITGDFDGIIAEYDSLGSRDTIFAYLDRCIEYIGRHSAELPENVEHLLLMDATIRRNFVRAIMKNLPMLIKLDLNKVTNLLIQVFSLIDIINALDSTLETSPEGILNTLKKLPDLQLLVLDALLKSKSNAGNTLQLPNSYFNRYLNLLSIHDKANVAGFLRRQKSLNITYCLKVCRQNNIDDAVIYLLLRAGNLEEAVHLLIDSFASNIARDLDTCSALVKTAHSICHEYYYQISYDIIERMWFEMLRLSIKSLNESHDRELQVNGLNGDRTALSNGLSDSDGTHEGESHPSSSECDSDDCYASKLRTLVEDIFNSGILKYVKFPNALEEIIGYEASLDLFKSPLHNLLSDFQLQTYIANSASTISKVIMNKEFRSRQMFNNRGVVISTINRNAKINRNLVCQVCNKNLVYNLHFDPDLSLKSEKQSRKSKSHHAEDSKISAVEEQIGLISQVPIQGDKSNVPPPVEASSMINNIYNDRLSAFIRRTRASKALGHGHALSSYPPIIQTIARDADSFRREPIIVYWCRHSFHQQCAPLCCPVCNIDE